MRSATRKKIGKDKAYLEFIHTERCVIRYCCSNQWPSQSSSLIEAHHAGDHGFSQKADDRTAIPLCRYHHTDGWESVHKLGKRFWEHHGINRDELLKELQARYTAALC